MAVIKAYLLVAGTPGVDADAQRVGVANADIGRQGEVARTGGGRQAGQAYGRGGAAVAVGGGMGCHFQFAAAHADFNIQLHQSEGITGLRGNAVFIVSIVAAFACCPANGAGPVCLVKGHHADRPARCECHICPGGGEEAGIAAGQGPVNAN